jgi:hypothetical protein
MRHQGVIQCQKRIQEIADYVSLGTTSTVLLQLPQTHFNQHTVSASMEIVENQHPFYATMTFSPLSRHLCDASFETINYWPSSCKWVAKNAFKEAKNLGKMRQDILALTAGEQLQIFLLPAGQGCVSIKKQMLFDAL